MKRKTTFTTAAGLALATMSMGLLAPPINAAPADVVSVPAVRAEVATAVSQPLAPEGSVKKKRAKKNKKKRAKVVVLRSESPHRFGTVAYSQWYARVYMARRYGWGTADYRALERLWYFESRWGHRAHNPSSGAYGIPQALPGSKMKSAGSDWATNPETQIRWGLEYIRQRYRTPSRAYGFFRSNNWY